MMGLGWQANEAADLRWKGNAMPANLNRAGGTRAGGTNVLHTPNSRAWSFEINSFSDR
jgi:hypothetical protein